ncbi:hypothetical protein [Flavonifractor sp. An91]|uniref:hypothetical protein n=1 Tax=Flavonifractor sp. An91 TaxID=1965665 RepID=UPI0013A67C93|nr:hypothetical protein [Flavonifractor sp. An91]
MQTKEKIPQSLQVKSRKQGEKRTGAKRQQSAGRQLEKSTKPKEHFIASVVRPFENHISNRRTKRQ